MKQNNEKSIKKSVIRTFKEIPRFVYFIDACVLVDAILQFEHNKWFLTLAISLNILVWGGMVLYDYFKNETLKSISS